ncbi:MAG: M3 family metallopeptidase, partial [Thermacetogeniaceae bacterium]
MNKDTWQLEDIYQNHDEWEKELQQVETLVGKMEAYQGMLAESADTFFAALDLSTQIQELIVKVYSYARMKRDEDNSNPTAQALFGRAAALLTRVDTALSFIHPEILALSDKTISNYRQDNRFVIYSHYLDDILRQKPHTLSSAEEQIVARTGEITRTPDETFKMLNNADLTFPVIRDDEGNEIEITKGNFISLMQNKSRRVRRETFQALYGTYLKLENTFATALNAGVKRDIFYAKVRRHQSARSASLFADNIPPAVYDSLVQTVHSNFGTIHRYMKLRKKILSLDELHMYDIYVPLVDVEWQIPY